MRLAKFLAVVTKFWSFAWSSEDWQLPSRVLDTGQIDPSAYTPEWLAWIRPKLHWFVCWIGGPGNDAVQFGSLVPTFRRNLPHASTTLKLNIRYEMQIYECPTEIHRCDNLEAKKNWFRLPVRLCPYHMWLSGTERTDPYPTYTK